MFAVLKQGASRIFNSIASAAVANAPTICVGVGILGVGAACVMACLATKKLEAAIDETRTDLELMRDLRESVENAEAHPDDPDVDIPKHSDGTPYTKKDVRKRTFAAYARMIARYAKLYGPAALTFIAGTIAILYGHGLLQTRYAAMAASAAGLTNTLREYRKRVADYIGDEEEDVLYRGGEITKVFETVIDDENGEGPAEAIVDKVVVSGDKVITSDPYCYIFDEATTAHSRNYSHINGVNLQILRNGEENAQRLLDGRPGGFVELNEVLTAIGLERDPKAIGLGWVNMPGCAQRIDFGIRDYVKSIGLENQPASVHDFVLNFNCDGPILEVLRRAKKAERDGRLDYFCA